MKFKKKYLVNEKIFFSLVVIFLLYQSYQYLSFFIAHGFSFFMDKLRVSKSGI